MEKRPTRLTTKTRLKVERSVGRFRSHFARSSFRLPPRSALSAVRAREEKKTRHWRPLRWVSIFPLNGKSPTVVSWMEKRSTIELAWNTTPHRIICSLVAAAGAFNPERSRQQLRRTHSCSHSLTPKRKKMPKQQWAQLVLRTCNREKKERKNGNTLIK